MNSAKYHFRLVKFAIRIVFAIIIFWFALLLYAKAYGPRNTILMRVPNAQIYPADVDQFTPKAFIQDLLPDGYILPNTVISVNVKDGIVNIKDFANIDFFSLHLDRCQINGWDAFHDPNLFKSKFIKITNSTFTEITGRSTSEMEKFRSQSGEENVYYIGSM
jgi:hypothetical protein